MLAILSHMFLCNEAHLFLALNHWIILTLKCENPHGSISDFSHFNIHYLYSLFFGGRGPVGEAGDDRVSRLTGHVSSVSQGGRLSVHWSRDTPSLKCPQNVRVSTWEYKRGKKSRKFIASECVCRWLSRKSRNVPENILSVRMRLTQKIFCCVLQEVFWSVSENGCRDKSQIVSN